LTIFFLVYEISNKQKIIDLSKFKSPPISIKKIMCVIFKYLSEIKNSCLMFRPGDRTKLTLKGLDSISDAEKLLRLESREVREYIQQMVHYRV